MKNPKEFDCVEMMHQGQEEVKRRLVGLSKEETLAYYKRRAEALREEQFRVQSDSESSVGRA